MMMSNRMFRAHSASTVKLGSFARFSGYAVQTATATLNHVSPKTQACLDVELKHAAHNYAPMPVVISRADGVFFWDVDGKKYYDFLASYSAVNQGHGHPKIIAALEEQLSRVPLTSRAFHNDQLGPYAKTVTELMGYDKGFAHEYRCRDGRNSRKASS